MKRIYQILLPVIISGLGVGVFLLLSSGCSSKKNEDSQKENPFMKYAKSWSCPYTKDFLRDLYSENQEEDNWYADRNQEYKGFVILDHCQGQEIYELDPAITDDSNDEGKSYTYNPNTKSPWFKNGEIISPISLRFDKKGAWDYEFYTNSHTYENTYSKEDIDNIKKLMMESKSSCKKDKYTHVAYKLVDKGDGHCNLEYLNEKGKLYVLSDVEEKFTLRSLLKDGCENKLDFLENPDGTVRVESSDPECLNLKRGFLQLNVDNPSDNLQHYKYYLILKAKNEYNNISSLMYKSGASPDYYLDTVLSFIEKKFSWLSLSSIISDECKNNIESVQFDPSYEYTKVSFNAEQILKGGCLSVDPIIDKSLWNQSSCVIISVITDYNKEKEEVKDFSQINWTASNVEDGINQPIFSDSDYNSTNRIRVMGCN